MRKSTRVGQRHQSPEELFRQISSLAAAFVKHGGSWKADEGRRGALTKAVASENEKRGKAGPWMHYVNGHRWMRLWKAIKKAKRKPAMLLKWLREFGNSRVFHVSGLDKPIKILEQDHLPGEKRSLRKMSEAEIRVWVQSRSRSKQVQANPKRKPMGRAPKPADDLSKAIKRFLKVWKRVRTALPRTAAVPVEDLVTIRPLVKKLSAVTRKLKTMAGFGVRTM